ncbi:8088_t:CDS:2 [Funneliformis geosporum]|uniref:19659_t:CDS:1 n=1 Tax=Funneliformis geosporum TaxID=1117311 RepID=A0A9W4SRY2_9GLOM|nr:8088_t:CDS:2 [Funneliformis geosporum]CAI2180738.1 19659_t:CDS:2 [Funneliformis geosporum]
MSGIPSGAMLNIDQIEVVRSRMIQVWSAQTEFLEFLASAEDPNSISWADYLNRFNIFLSKHTGLSNTFIDSNLRKNILHPKDAPPVEVEQTFITLLRTKQTPEIENLEEEIKHEISSQENLLDLELETKKNDDDNKWDKLFDEWDRRYKEHDIIANNASDICENILGDINLKKRLDDNIGLDKSDDAENIDIKQDLTMEKILIFMSSGK